MYAPEDEIPEAYHRTMYVFACKDGRCHQYQSRDCYRVFRSQTQEDVDENDIRGTVCHVCGLLGNKRCAKCHRASYCSRAHQIHDWPQHKNACLQSVEDVIYEQPQPSVLFPLAEIISENENYDAKTKEEFGDTHSALVPTALLQTTSISDEDVKEGWVSEEYEEASAEVDNQFLRFQKRIRHDPDQVLRYARTPDASEPEPLWVNEKDKISDIPVCPGCGKKRTFEFQIMPQMLSHLGIDHSKPEALDFGSLLVYSCPDSCGSAESDHHEEFIGHQNFSDDGIMKPKTESD